MKDAHLHDSAFRNAEIATPVRYRAPVLLAGDMGHDYFAPSRFGEQPANGPAVNGFPVLFDLLQRLPALAGVRVQPLDQNQLHANEDIGDPDVGPVRLVSPANGQFLHLAATMLKRYQYPREAFSCITSGRVLSFQRWRATVDYPIQRAGALGPGHGRPRSPT